MATDLFGLSTQQDILTGGDGAKLYGWNLLNGASADAIDVNITNAGALTINCNAVNSSFDSATPNAPYVYKNVDSELFVIEADFSDTSDALTEASGILLRDTDASAGEDSLLIQRYHDGAAQRVRGVRYINNTRAAVFDVAVTHAFLRIELLNRTTATFWTRATAAVGWTYRAVTTVGWAGTIQAGVAAQTGNTSNNFVSQFAAVTINRVPDSTNRSYMDGFA